MTQPQRDPHTQHVWPATPQPAAKPRSIAATPYWLRVCVVIAIATIGVLIVKVTPPARTSSPPAASESAPPAATTVAPPAGPVSSFGDGIYEVGKDVVTGTYLAPGAQDATGCYWKRSKTASGEVNAIIANAITQGGQVIVTVNAGEFFQARGCGTWTKR